MDRGRIGADVDVEYKYMKKIENVGVVVSNPLSWRYVGTTVVSSELDMTPEDPLGIISTHPQEYNQK